MSAASQAAPQVWAEYQARLGRHQAEAARAAQADRRAGLAKLLVFFALLGLAWLAWVNHRFSGHWLWPALALLLALFVLHDRILRRRARAERLVAHYQRGLARLEDRWIGMGSAGERFRNPAHPYADDLDIFGRGSLFQLLSLARTPMGEERLAAWLRAPAPPATIAERQRRVAEWRGDLDLRERVFSLGDDLKQRMDPARLAGWATQAARPIPPALRVLYGALGLATLAALGLAFTPAGVGPLFALVLLQGAILYRQRERISAAVRGQGANGEGLAIFAEVLACRPDADPAAAPALRRLARLADWIEASESTLGKVLDLTVLYSLHLTVAAENWRHAHGAAVPGWLYAVGEFEALLSLASHAYEHPRDPFPELAPGGLEFTAEGLGHPLLPERSVVRNPVRLDAELRLLLISGSNMAGKSTLLRAVGCNAVLAQMGAPVRAERLRLGTLQVGTRLRTADSLQEGRSGFYSEILRLRQIFEFTTGPLPLLYLFDELLEGTNSHDRVVGAEGLLRALLAQPALGMVTTHDLALAAMAERLGPRVRNVHMEDRIEGNDVRFDHKLREGVVARSNALALMRLVGLDV